MKIGVIGNGYVGKATQLAFPCESLVYDTDKKKCSPSGLKLEDLRGCTFVFVCVPTPMNPDGSCHTSIVESVVAKLIDSGIHKRRIVIRSTVPVGTSKSLGVSFMPEFLTEAKWQGDVIKNRTWIFGYDPPAWIDWTPKDRMAADFLKLAQDSAREVVILKSDEAELLKLTRNAFLATKISFFNEIKTFCDKNKIDYNKVREAITEDKRIGDSHSHVPGPDGENGFGGTCLPKDSNSLLSQFSQLGIDAPVLRAVKFRNEQIDRPQKDWQNNKGRAVV
jgi:UDPglucose 6-dehydrogenase